MTTLIKTFAKLNLSLLVFPPCAKHYDLATSYHPICSIFQSISLFDTLEITKTPDSHGLNLTCSKHNLPVDETNIISKIYSYFKSDIPFGLTVHIQKNIPIGSGLGGGSSNAAGFITYLNAACGWNCNLKKLEDIGTHFGSDIPFFFTGGTALVQGIGNEITPVTINSPPYYLLINPNISISSALVYQALDRQQSWKALPRPVLSQETQTNQLFEATASQIEHLLNHPVAINMLKPVVWEMHPMYKNIEKQLSEMHAPAAHLTGSGATLFIPFQDKKESQLWNSRLKQVFPDYFVHLTHAVHP
ncbi:4-(cytidine 5'-diphospho)-2-C-methyl-D-erythritol kinase [Thermoproteota archaeon]